MVPERAEMSSMLATRRSSGWMKPSNSVVATLGQHDASAFLHVVAARQAV
jgi:hypothetical protein